MKSAKRGFVKAAGKHLPEMRLARRYHGLIVLHKLEHRDTVQAWPRKRGKPKSAVTREQNADFKRFVQGVKDTSDADKVGARLLAHGTTDTWRDVLSRAVTGSLIELDNPDIATVKTFLDQLGTITGSVIVCTDDGWVAMAPPTADAVLAFDVTTHLPVWVDPPIDAITELTGDVLAGPGDGSQAATLAASGVVAGTYDPARITVDAKGRVTAATNSAVSLGIDQLHGDVLAGPGSGDQAAALNTTGVAAGAYTRLSATIDAKGRITVAASGVNDAAANQLTGDVTAGPGAGSQVATLAASGVTAGVYTRSSITVDAKGRVTVAASGVNDAAANQLTGDVTAGPGAGSQIATLAASGVAAGSYSTANITVDAKGRITAASDGSASPGSGSGLFGQVLSTLPTQAGTGFTANAGTGNTVSDELMGINLRSTGGGIVYTAAVPATPYFRRALLMPDAKAGIPGFGWYDGTKLHFVYLGTSQAGLLGQVNVQRNDTVNHYSGTDYNIRWNINDFPVWLRLGDDGVNVTFYVAADGADWQVAFTTTKATGYLGATGYSHIFFGCPGAAGGATLLSYQ